MPGDVAVQALGDVLLEGRPAQGRQRSRAIPDRLLGHGVRRRNRSSVEPAWPSAVASRTASRTLRLGARAEGVGDGTGRLRRQILGQDLGRGGGRRGLRIHQSTGPTVCNVRRADGIMRTSFETKTILGPFSARSRPACAKRATDSGYCWHPSFDRGNAGHHAQRGGQLLQLQPRPQVGDGVVGARLAGDLLHLDLGLAQRDTWPSSPGRPSALALT